MADLFEILSPLVGKYSEIVLYCGPLERPHEEDLIRSYCGEKKKNVLLLLATYGGDAHVAYRLARCFKEHFESFSIFIHTFCKSAGTLLALGANEIIMSDHAEIGPLDVQLLKADEVGERSSGLTITQALESLQSHAFNMFEEYFMKLRVRSGRQITTMSAMNVAANLTVGLFAPIYGQIDPMRVGEIHRAVMVSMYYGERLGQDNLKDKSLERLVTGYPDHGFVIDRTETKDLFKNVREPSEEEKILANHLNKFMTENINSDLPMCINLTQLYNEKKEREKPHEQSDEPRNNEEAGCNKEGELAEERPPHDEPNTADGKDNEEKQG